VEERGAQSDRLVKVLTGVAAALLLVVVALLFFILGRETADRTASPAQTTADGAGTNFDFSILNQIREILGRDYVSREALDDQTLYEAAIQGLINSLQDTGTFYVDAESYKVENNLSGTFDGIGAHITQQNNEIVIAAPIKNTPAERAGLTSGDVIVAVNGESTKGWTTTKTAATIRGPRGTEVTITIRHRDGTVKDYTLVRARVEVESVTTTPPSGSMVDSAGNPVRDIGYMRIREFTLRTPGEVQAAVQELKNGGAKAIVIDVRDNLGGVLNATISVADLFLDSGVIVTQRDRDGRETSVAANAGQITKDMPLVILQNSLSASAAEVLAAALQDNGRAVVIGEKSFGKGTVNIARELRDGGALFVTIAQWLTPKGALIDHVGVRPDIEVKLTDEDFDLRRDRQLFTAIDVLRGQIRATSTP
jgi:carboxyl-terminal processing protease